MTNPKAAEIHQGNDQFYPPAREITFNQNLTRNDGLLCDTLAAANNVSYDVAVKRVDDFNRENLKRLSEGLEVELKEVGIFRKDTSGILVFEPNREANFLRSSFGLSSFRSPAIQRDSVERKIEKQILKALPKEAPAAANVTVAKEGINLIKYWPAAAVLLVLIVASSVLMKSDVLNNISINYSDLNPFDTSSESVYGSRTENFKLLEPKMEKDEIDLWLESIPDETAVKEVKKSNVVKRFHVIGGCFEIKSNADKMMRRLKQKGFEPSLVGKNRRGLQRVAFGSYETRSEARRALKKIKRTQMKSAWLFVSRK